MPFAVRNLLCVVLWGLAGCAASTQLDLEPCRSDEARQKARSNELQALVSADQAIRKKGFFDQPPEALKRIEAEDRGRRMRVGEIFGEGCFSKPEDYAAAALIYQHGDVPEHYLQAFMWAKRAVELGDERQKRMMALAIDRYLVNTDRKQLFASQAGKNDLASPCFCLEPVEMDFPDDRRQAIGRQSLAEAIDWLKGLNEGKDCPNVECSRDRKPTPAGSVPGLW